MPEYLAPGVYIEETSFRSKSIEGVSTTTAGFVGPTRWGPVSGRPELITSLADFERIYGGLDDLVFEGKSQRNYLAHAVRAFFEEGGQRLYVSRIFNFGDEAVEKYYASFTPKRAASRVRLQARFPGAAGGMRIFFTLLIGPNILSWSGSAGPKTPTLTRVQEFTLLYVRRSTRASEASKAIHEAADKLPDGSSKTVVELIAQAAEAQTSKPAEVYKAAKTAAHNLKAAVDAVISAIDAASTTTPQSVAQAARVAANKSREEPAKTVANLVAKAAEEAAAKGGATIESVKGATQKAADDLQAAIDAIATAVNTVSATDAQAIAKAARTEANKAKAEPAKTAADLMAKAAEEAAAKGGATAQSVKDATKTAADNMKSAADAVANAASTPPTAISVAEAARAAANKSTAEPARTAANLVAKVAEGEAAKGDATIQSVSEATKTAAHDMEVAADRVAGVALTPWLPFSEETKGLYVSHLVSDATGSYWKLNDIKLSELVVDSVDSKVEIRPITVLVEISRPVVDAQGLIKYSEPESLGEYNFDPRSATGLTRIFTHKPATRLEALTTPFAIETPPDQGLTNDQNLVSFVQDLMSSAFDGLDTDRFSTNALRASYTLVSEKTDDGVVPGRAAYEGRPEFTDITGDPLQMPQNGLLAFEVVEDISIVAAPGYSAISNADGSPNDDVRFAIHGAVIDHCEKMRYRVAVLDTPPNKLVSEALDFRNQRSSKYAALYYPWVTILDPLTDRRLNLPPSGFVAGIYARNDTEHAVSKAPANEVVRLAIDFEQRINKAQQDVLNPEGVNCFRYFPGRGFLLWGARTISDDPEWKYISVRRYFAYLEHSIDRGTQWVVFENNGPQLWDNVRHTIEDFLLNEWKMGALLGDKPEQAYFVRCDRSTMTQNDLDNGRLICLIGVAVVKPAEFVIFRLGQWTATSTVS
jgi:phage tail sheath protein FI